jgi:hypothetical protein
MTDEAKRQAEIIVKLTKANAELRREVDAARYLLRTISRVGSLPLPDRDQWTEFQQQHQTRLWDIRNAANDAAVAVASAEFIEGLADHLAVKFPALGYRPVDKDDAAAKVAAAVEVDAAVAAVAAKLAVAAADENGEYPGDIEAAAGAWPWVIAEDGASWTVKLPDGRTGLVERLDDGASFLPWVGIPADRRGQSGPVCAGLIPAAAWVGEYYSSSSRAAAKGASE